MPTVNNQNDSNGTPVLKPRILEDEFRNMFPDLMKGIQEDSTFKCSESTQNWVSELLQYNVPHGKLARGQWVVETYNLIANSEQGKEEDMKLSMIVGWCVEFFQSCCLVADDIMDGSELRRGRPCWYKREKVGLSAINDAFFLENFIYFTLKKYLKGTPFYMELVETFHEFTLYTLIGQSLDTRTSLEGNPDSWTMETYSTIVEYKTSYYSFVLPFRLAMIMAGTFEKSDIYKQVERILLEMGQLFQIKDDFLDCFGDPKVTGKIGTDIEERKCTWLLVESIRLIKASDDKEQEKLLEEKYLAGKYDPSAVEEVKRMYEGLGMQKYYSEHVANKLSWIRTEIGKLSESGDFPPGLTTMLQTVLKQTFS